MSKPAESSETRESVETMALDTPYIVDLPNHSNHWMQEYPFRNFFEKLEFIGKIDSISHYNKDTLVAQTDPNNSNWIILTRKMPFYVSFGPNSYPSYSAYRYRISQSQLETLSTMLRGKITQASEKLPPGVFKYNTAYAVTESFKTERYGQDFHGPFNRVLSSFNAGDTFIILEGIFMRVRRQNGSIEEYLTSNVDLKQLSSKSVLDRRNKRPLSLERSVAIADPNSKTSLRSTDKPEEVRRLTLKAVAIARGGNSNPSGTEIQNPQEPENNIKTPLNGNKLQYGKTYFVAEPFTIRNLFKSDHIYPLNLGDTFTLEKISYRGISMTVTDGLGVQRTYDLKSDQISELLEYGSKIHTTAE